MNHDPCPSADDLAGYVQCRISEREAESISDHLATCSRCEATVVGLETNGETVLSRLREGAGPFPFQDEPELRRVVETAKRQPPGDCPPPAVTVQFGAMPEQLRDYQLLEKIGEGGMGAVYRAIHTRLQKTVALKLLSRSRLEDVEAVNRFQREMSIVGRLQHPNIVQAHDAGEEGGYHYLVMEYVVGTDLSEILRQRGPLPVNAACEIIAQAALGLQYAHENGLVHRDIKPSNLMLAVGGESSLGGAGLATVKILDLGLARLHGAESAAAPELTTDGQIMGTLDYMAPEQGGDSRGVDIRADIYALGATLYKLLTGETPFSSGRHRTVMQKLVALASEPAPSVRERRPEVPEALAAIVARMLAKSPQDRFATPLEVATALQPYRDGTLLPALLVEGSQILSVSRPGPTVRLESPPVPPRRRQWGQWVASFGGAALVLGLVLTVVTKQGTIEVESPEGELPADVQVVVGRSGADVEVLQADNKWRAAVAGGEVQLSLRGGDERFELQNSRLTVRRFGRNVVTVHVKRNTAVGAAEGPSVTPLQPPVAPPRRVKPFVVIRGADRAGEFESLYGALTVAGDGDVIEVHSSGAVSLAMPEPITRKLHLRAGQGLRPHLVLQERTLVLAGLVIEGCDLDQRQGDWITAAPNAAPWEFRRCRIWGNAVGHGSLPRLVFEDCLVDTALGFGVTATQRSEITVTNCAIRTRNSLFGFTGGTEPVTVTLRGNTLRFVESGSVVAVDSSDRSPITVEAEGNLFEIRTENRPTMVVGENHPGQVDWIGRANLFAGPWNVVVVGDTLQQGSLADWNRRWKQPEQNSVEVASLLFTGARTGDWGSANRGVLIQGATEQIRARSQQASLGPDWSLVGVGENYLRALSAEGRGVPAARLRPEPPAGGAVVIIREGQEVGGFPTLALAVEAARSGDVVELRTDDPLPGAQWHGASRQLTLRAGPGYAPVIHSALGTMDDRLIVEGLTLRDGLVSNGPPPSAWRGEGAPYAGSGGIQRLTNCVALNPQALQVSGWFRNTGENPPEIRNCVFGIVSAGVTAGQTLRIHNSLLGAVRMCIETTDRPGRLELAQSVVWNPDSSTGWGDSSIFAMTPLAISAEHSLFVSPGSVIGLTDMARQFRGWTGSHNVYVKPAEFIATGNLWNLAGWQQAQKSDTDSLELQPLSWDPENWRVWRERSAGYLPRGEGADYGVEIDRLAKRLAPTPVAAE